MVNLFLLPGEVGRPADVLIPGWSSGKDVAYDVTVHCSDKSPAGLRSEPTSCLQVMHFPLPRDGSLINLGKSPRFGKRPNFLRISFSAPFPKSIANSSEGQSASYLWRYYSIQWKPVEGCSSRHQIVIWNCFWFDKLNQSTNSETAMLSSWLLLMFTPM